MNLQLSLITKYFDQTKQLIKPEDYRKITTYWCSRLLLQNGKKQSQKFWKDCFYDFSAEELQQAILHNCNVHRTSLQRLLNGLKKPN